MDIKTLYNGSVFTADGKSVYLDEEVFIVTRARSINKNGTVVHSHKHFVIDRCKIQSITIEKATDGSLFWSGEGYISDSHRWVIEKIGPKNIFAEREAAEKALKEFEEQGMNDTVYPMTKNDFKDFEQMMFGIL